MYQFSYSPRNPLEIYKYHVTTLPVCVVLTEWFASRLLSPFSPVLLAYGKLSLLCLKTQSLQMFHAWFTLMLLEVSFDFQRSSLLVTTSNGLKDSNNESFMLVTSPLWTEAQLVRNVICKRTLELRSVSNNQFHGRPVPQLYARALPSKASLEHSAMCTEIEIRSSSTRAPFQ